MTKALTFEVLGPVRGKGRPRFAGSRVYTPEQTRAYENNVKTAAFLAMVEHDRTRFDGPVSVEMIAYFTPPDSWSAKKRAGVLGQYRPKKPDTDNISKMKDALNGIVFADDAQVVDDRIVKKYGETNKLVITVTPVEVCHGA